MADTSSQTGGGPDRRVTLRRAVLFAMYVLLVAATCFAAYQIRVFVIRRQAPPEFAPKWSETAPPPPQSQPWNLNAPGQLAKVPMIDVGLRPFAADPGGIAPPPGSQALPGFERQAYKLKSQQRIYLCPGEPAQVKSYYEKVLARAGFTPVPNRAGPDPALTLLFAKGTTLANLTLQKLAGQAKMVRVVLIVTSEEMTSE